MAVPKVAAIHDMSGFGRCSLTVIIPVLSTMGVQVCPFPTAILSTHSGGFGKSSFHDLTVTMEDYSSHWQSIDLRFDCIYSGFLGSARQIEIVSTFFRDFSTPEPLIVVDPVMADNGRLYETYTPEMQDKMRLLAMKADVITPNPTEAFFLLGEPYPDRPLDVGAIKRLLKGLSETGPSAVVITGIQTDGAGHINAGYERDSGSYWQVPFERIPVNYPGTGDIYSSVLVGGLLKGDSLPAAMDRATQFISLAVRTTHASGTPAREGVLIEKVLHWLSQDFVSRTYTAI
ncbi:MAG: pyridoxamine kinase [Bacillota bacterium]|nr:pyridoxamine kinase [Bacillota bacterium]